LKSLFPIYFLKLTRKESGTEIGNLLEFDFVGSPPQS